MPNEFIIPVYDLDFDFDEKLVSGKDNITLRRMNLQLQNFRKEAGFEKAISTNYKTASHAFFIELKKSQDSSFSIYDALSEFLNSNPNVPDTLFVCLRMLGDFHTGYNEIIFHGCVDNQSEPSLSNVGAFHRVSFHAAVLRPLLKDEISKLGSIYAKIQTCLLDKQIAGKMQIVIRRFNAGFLQQGSDEAVVDASIGLEALLLSDSKQELKYKLALRGAALICEYGHSDLKIEEVFKDFQDIYDYRSIVAHGAQAKSKDFLKPIPKSHFAYHSRSDLALRYVRIIFEILIEHDEYFTPKAIDDMILNKIALKTG